MKYQANVLFAFERSLCPSLETGIEDVFAEFDSTLSYEVYSLDGIMIGNSIENIVPGIYIVRPGNAVKKIAVK
ncbi:MAG: hypothetical protein K2M69_09205 [Muribaculaceae bacterium]|nr:hypothetical protein [Muribaculaceae bacterium]